MNSASIDVVTENEEVVRKSKLSKKNKLILIGMAVALLICVTIIIVSSQSTSKRLAKQLDLGQKYLEEMDYEQAIVAFNKAIEIDPMSVEAYLGMVEVYIRTTDFETALEYAKKGYEATGDECLKEKLDMLEDEIKSIRLAEQLDLGNKYLEEMDYEQAIVAFNKALEIDPMNAEAYLGLVEVYIRTTDFETALEYAQKGYEATGDERLKEKIDMIESGSIFADNGRIMKTSFYNNEEDLSYYVTYTYNLKGNIDSISAYTPNDVLIDEVEYKYDEEDRCIWGVASFSGIFLEDETPLSRGEYQYDDEGNITNVTRYDDKGNEINHSEYNYESNGHEIIITYYPDGGYYRDESDAEGNRISYERYDSNNKLITYTERKYDNGHCIEYWYDSEGKLTSYVDYECNSQGEVVKAIDYDADGNITNMWSDD
jgi:Tfp pilus assembly protein PilF